MGVSKDINDFEANMSKIFYLDLAFESYEDDIHTSIPFLNKICNDINYLRKNKELLKDNEKLKMSQNILSDFNQLLDMVGREKFYFYDDGVIEYKWNREDEENNE